MSPRTEDGGGGPREDPSPLPPPSPRVRLEIAFLDADQAALTPAAPAALDERNRLTVLVVAAEADLRRYVRECLRERSDLRVVEAASITAAVALVADHPPDLLIVDEPESDVLLTLPQLRAIVMVDDVPRDAPTSGPRRSLLAHPFSAERLVVEVSRLLA
jgi:CheY-like chemotaxis protein